MDAFIGEIRAFGFGYVPQGWLLCDGSELPISAFAPLYAVIGVNYGGDGRSTFKLPNLNASTPMHWGTPDPRGGPGFNPCTIGKTYGAASVALSPTQLPAHSHSFNGATASAQVTNPVGALPATLMTTRAYYAYQTGTASNAQLAGSMIGPAGNPTPAPHENRQPILTMLLCICNDGEFPVRP